MTHSWMWCDSAISMTWLIHMCDMTQSYTGHDSFTCGDMTPSQENMSKWLFRIWNETHSYGHGSFIRKRWLIVNESWHTHQWHQYVMAHTWMRLIHSQAMAHSNAATWILHKRKRHNDSFKYGTWLIRTDMTHSYMGDDSFICGDMTHSCVAKWLIQWHDSFTKQDITVTRAYMGRESCTCGTWLIHEKTYSTSHIGMWHKARDQNYAHLETCPYKSGWVVSHKRDMSHKRVMSHKQAMSQKRDMWQQVCGVRACDVF